MAQENERQEKGALRKLEASRQRDQRHVKIETVTGNEWNCDLNHRLAISEASVGRPSACKSCKSELRQSAPSDVWSIGWPEEQSRKHPLTDWNLNPQDC